LRSRNSFRHGTGRHRRKGESACPGFMSMRRSSSVVRLRRIWKAATTGEIRLTIWHLEILKNMYPRRWRSSSLKPHRAQPYSRWRESRLTNTAPRMSTNQANTLSLLSESLRDPSKFKPFNNQSGLLLFKNTTHLEVQTPTLDRILIESTTTSRARLTTRRGRTEIDLCRILTKKQVYEHHQAEDLPIIQDRAQWHLQDDRGNRVSTPAQGSHALFKFTRSKDLKLR